jgi:hypothetical protein
MAKAASALRVKQTGPRFDVKHLLNPAGHTTPETAKCLTIEPAAGSQTTVPLTTKGPFMRVIGVPPAKVSVEFTDPDCAGRLVPTSAVGAVNIAYQTAGKLDLTNLHGKDVFVLNEHVNSIVTGPGPIVAGGAVSRLAFANAQAAAAVKSFDASGLIGDTDPTGHTDGKMTAGEAKPLLEIFTGLATLVLPKDKIRATSMLASAKTHACPANISFAAGSTPPDAIVLPAGTAKVELGANTLANVATIDLSACTKKVEFFTTAGGDTAAANLKATFPGLQTLLANHANMSSVRGLPAGTVGGAAGSDARIGEISILGATGFNTGADKLCIADLAARAKKVVVPQMNGANYDLSRLPDNNTELEKLEIYIRGTDGTETKVTKKEQLSGAAAPSRPESTTTTTPGARAPSTFAGGKATVGADGVCYLSGSAVSDGVEAFNGTPKQVWLPDAAAARAIKMIPLIGGVPILVGTPPAENSDATALATAAGASSVETIFTGGGNTSAAVDLTKLSGLAKVAALRPTPAAGGGGAAATTPSIVGTKLLAPASAKVIDMTGITTPNVTIHADGVSTLEELTLAATTTDVAAGGKSLVSGHALDLRALPGLKKFIAGGADMTAVQLDATLASKLTDLDLRGKDGALIAASLDGAPVGVDYSKFNVLASLALGGSGVPFENYKLPAACKKLILGKGVSLPASGVVNIPAGVEAVEIDASIVAHIKDFRIPASVKEIIVTSSTGDPVKLMGVDGKLAIPASFAALETVVIGNSAAVTSLTINKAIRGLRELDLSGSAVATVEFEDQNASKALQTFRASPALAHVFVSGTDRVASGAFTPVAGDFDALVTADFAKCGNSITAINASNAPRLTAFFTGDHVTALTLTTGHKATMVTFSSGKALASLKFDAGELFTGAGASDKTADFKTGFSALTSLYLNSPAVAVVALDAAIVKAFHVHGGIKTISADGTDTSSWISDKGNPATKAVALPSGTAIEDFGIIGLGMANISFASGVKVPKKLYLGETAKVTVQTADQFDACELFDLSRVKAAFKVGIAGTDQTSWNTIRLAPNARVVIGAEAPVAAYTLGNAQVVEVVRLPSSTIPKIILGPDFQRLYLPAGTTDLATKFTDVQANGAKLADVKVFIGDTEQSFSDVGFRTLVTADLASSGVVDGTSATEIQLTGTKANLTSLKLGPDTAMIDWKANPGDASFTSLITGAGGAKTVVLTDFVGLTTLDSGGSPAIDEQVLTSTVTRYAAGSHLKSLTLNATNGAGLLALDISGRNHALKVGTFSFAAPASNKLDLSGAFAYGTATAITSTATNVSEVTNLFTCDLADLTHVTLPTDLSKVFVYPRLKAGAAQAITGIPSGSIILNAADLAELGKTTNALQLTLPDAAGVDPSAMTFWVARADGVLESKHLHELGCNVELTIPSGKLGTSASLALAGPVTGGKTVTVKIDAADATKVAAVDLSHGLVVQVSDNPLVSPAGAADLTTFTALTAFDAGGQAVKEVIIPEARKTALTKLGLATSEAAIALKVKPVSTAAVKATDFTGFAALATVTGDASKCAMLASPAGASASCVFTLVGELSVTSKYDFSLLIAGQGVILPAGENSKVTKVNLAAVLKNDASGTALNLSSFLPALEEVTGTVAEYQAQATALAGGAGLTLKVTDAITSGLSTGLLYQAFAGTTQVKEIQFTATSANASGLAHVQHWNAARLSLTNIKCGPTPPTPLADTSEFTGLTKVMIDGKSLPGTGHFFGASIPTARGTCDIVIAASSDATTSSKTAIDFSKIAENNDDLGAFQGVYVLETSSALLTLTSNGTAGLDSIQQNKIRFVTKFPDLTASADDTAARAALGFATATTPVTPPVAAPYDRVSLGAGTTIFDGVGTQTRVRLTGDWSTAKPSAATTTAKTLVTALDISTVLGVVADINNAIGVGANTIAGITDAFPNVTELVVDASQTEHVNLATFPKAAKVTIKGTDTIHNDTLTVPATCTELVFENVIALNTLKALIFQGSAMPTIKIGADIADLFGDGNNRGVTLAALETLTLPAGVPAEGTNADTFTVPSKVKVLTVANAGIKAFKGTLVLPGCLEHIYSSGTTDGTDLKVNGQDLEIKELALKGIELTAGSQIVCIKTITDANTPNLTSIKSRTDGPMNVCLLDAIAKQITALDVGGLKALEISDDNGISFVAVEDNDSTKFNTVATRAIAKHLGTTSTLDVAKCYFNAGDELFVTKASWDTVTSLTLTGDWTNKKIILVDAAGTPVTDGTVLTGGTLSAIPPVATAVDLKGAAGLAAVNVQPSSTTSLALTSLNISTPNCKVATVAFGPNVTFTATTGKTVTATSNTAFTKFTSRASGGTAGKLTFAGAASLASADFHGSKAFNAVEGLENSEALVYLDFSDSAATGEVALHGSALPLMKTLIAGDVDIKSGTESIFAAAGATSLAKMTDLVTLWTNKGIVLANNGETLKSLFALQHLRCHDLSCDSNGIAIDLSTCVALKYISTTLGKKVASLKFSNSAPVAVVDLPNSTALVNIEDLKMAGVQALSLEGCSAFKAFDTNANATSAKAADFSSFAALEVLDWQSASDVVKITGIRAETTFTRVRTAEIKHLETDSTGQLCLVGVTGFENVGNGTKIGDAGIKLKVPSGAAAVYVGDATTTNSTAGAMAAHLKAAQSTSAYNNGDGCALAADKVKVSASDVAVYETAAAAAALEVHKNVLGSALEHVLTIP